MKDCPSLLKFLLLYRGFVGVFRRNLTKIDKNRLNTWDEVDYSSGLKYSGQITAVFVTSCFFVAVGREKTTGYLKKVV